MEENSKQRKAGVVLQYLQIVLNIIIQLIYLPVVLRTLGAVEYGIFNTVSSTISYLSLLSLGLGSSYIRFYSIFKSKNDKAGIWKMNGLYILTFSLMGLAVIVCGSILAGNIQILFNETYSTQEIEVAKTLMVILTVHLALSFPASVFSSYIASQEKFIFQKVVNIGLIVIGPVANIILLSFGFRSIGMVLSTTLVSIAVYIINIFYCFSKLKMKVSFARPDLSLLKEIFVFTFFIAINEIVNQINWQTDKIILGKVVNGVAVAVYSVGSQINTMYTSFSTAISSIFAPKVNRIVAEGGDNSDKELSSLFIRVGRIQWFVLMLVLTGFIFFGQYFVIIWAGDEYATAYYVALLLMVPATIPLIQNIGIEIQRAKNKHRFRSVVYFLMALFNVGISIWFAFLWGEIGVATGTTISLVIANGLVMNLYYQKKLGIDIVAFWQSIAKTLPGMIAPVLFGSALFIFYDFVGLIDYVLLILGYVLVYCVSVVFLATNKEEKTLLKYYWSRLFGKRIFRK